MDMGYFSTQLSKSKISVQIETSNNKQIRGEIIMRNLLSTKIIGIFAVVSVLSFAGVEAAIAQCGGGCSDSAMAGYEEKKSKKDIVDIAVKSGSFNTLVAAVKAAGLVETLKGKGPYTVFAPTDEAFAKLPAGTVETLLKPENRKKLQDILTYHVVSGRVAAADVVNLSAADTVLGESVTIAVKKDKVMINNSQVVKTDIEASNGLIHVIDTVLLPPEGYDRPDIVDTAVSAGSFKTLVAAVKAAGLVETLKGKGPFTVFAPTDEAFAKLPAGTVEELLKPENKKKLQAVLTYHVIPGKLEASQVVKLKSSSTVNGQSVTFKVDKGTAMIDNATIVKTDIGAKNGVIHVIDTVILPK
jgi:transforming growth factor-beta-induced protein